MDLSKLVSIAQKSLGDNSWNVERVLRIGAELLSSVKDFPNLSYHDKIELVCQTILKMLDDAEKAEIVLTGGSTAKETTIHYLEECRKTVRTLLPVSLELLAVANGMHLAKIQEQCLPFVRGSWTSWASWSSWTSCFSVKVVQDTVTVVEDALKHPQEYLEEMRDLVSKVEKLFSEAALKTEQPAVVSLLQKAELSRLPPSPKSVDVSLPGESVSHSDVELSQ
jgi:hypothetical protein